MNDNDIWGKLELNNEVFDLDNCEIDKLKELLKTIKTRKDELKNRL